MQVSRMRELHPKSKAVAHLLDELAAVPCYLLEADEDN